MTERSEVVSEVAALRAELAATNRGLLAVYAELSEQSDLLEQARAAAEQASGAKAAFLANMSHEIRSPLNAVIGFTSLLLETALDAEQAEYAELIRAAGDHLRGVIDDILDLSKIESGRLDLEIIPFDLVACVEEAVGIIAPKAEEKRLALAALFAPDTPVTVLGDPVRLRQILVNLLSNAVKFTPAGQVTVDVGTAPAAPGRIRLAFDVTDTGVGIAADAAESIFAPFTQADVSTTRNFGGTGLGLAICRELASRMAGGITVRSTLGEGSTFTCSVELGLDDPTRLAGSDRVLAGRRMLVVHHQPVVAEALRRHLASWGAHVATTATVEEPAGDWSLVLLGATDALPADLARVAAHHHGPVVVTAPLGARPVDADGMVRAVLSTPPRRAQLRAAVLAALGLTGTPARPAAPTPAAPPPRTLHILLAEDNLVNQRMAAAILDRLGHPVDVVGDGEQAVDAVLAGSYDLVLMDLHMPRLDGIGATRRIRMYRPGHRPRIIALTASATDESRRACVAAGMDGFLAKPVEAADLAQVIDRILVEEADELLDTHGRSSATTHH